MVIALLGVVGSGAILVLGVGEGLGGWVVSSGSVGISITVAHLVSELRRKTFGGQMNGIAL